MKIRPSKTDLFFLRNVGPKAKWPERDYLAQGLLDLLSHPQTQKITAQGVARCLGCGFETPACYFVLPGGQKVHPLGSHYLLWHRESLTLPQLGKLCFQMSKHLKPERVKPPVVDASVAEWKYDDQVYVAPSGTECMGTLSVRYSPDGIILDFVDSNGEIIATNGLDLDTLCQMLKPNRAI